MCQLPNSLRLPALHRLGGNQIRADTECGRASQNKPCSSLLIHTTGSNQRNLRQGGVKRFYVFISANWRTREYFDEVCACPPRRRNFSWR